MNTLFIGKLWPEPTSSAAGKRMLQLISLFQQLGTVNFASTAAKTGNEINLTKLNVEEYAIELNSDTFDEFLQQLSPQCVVFDRFMTEEQFGWRVIEHCPEALRILDSEDLHFLRKARGTDVQNWMHDEEPNLLNDATYREIAAIYRSDLTLLVSDVEQSLLENTFQIPSYLLHYLPIFSTGTVQDLPSFDNRKDLMFIGNFLHEPNLDAVRYLKNELWPKIHSILPELKINIYGAYPNESVLQMNQPKQGFLVHGSVVNAMEVTKNARISFAPLRFGAGIKGKLLEAMECGTPSVTTRIGREGIASEQEWAGIVGHSTEELVEAIVELYGNKDFWHECQLKGAQILQQRFDRNQFEEHFIAKINELTSHLEQHRSQSIFSKVIQHQSLMSTKYLSKWIMEKQKTKD